jgi:hypothetical protein
MIVPPLAGIVHWVSTLCPIMIVRLSDNIARQNIVCQYAYLRRL